MKRRGISVLLALCMALTLLPVGALADDAAFTIVDGVLTRYTGSGGDVTIPTNVTSIGSDAFHGFVSLTSVTIPEGVTSIGRQAFLGCSSLTSVTIPESVTSIERSAFSGCSSLTRVTIPEGVTSIEGYVFNGCSSLTSMTIPEGVTGIGDFAFYQCTGLTSVTIPEGVTGIGMYAFSGCSSLMDVTIPSSVIGIGEHAFSGCSSLTSVTIPESVTSIGNSAFSHCIGLTDVTILSSVTSIGSSAFAGCTGLTTVTIQEGVTSIGNYAFQKCTSLTTVTIPSGVTSIGSYAFSECTDLTRVTIQEGVTRISIGDYAFQKCTSLTDVTIPSSVTSIGSYTFSNCTSLTDVTIPSSVTNIGSYTFSNCTSLTDVTIPSGVTNIGGYAFSGCTSLTDVTIPSSVTRIGISVFSGCTGLTSVTIPKSVTSIGTNAFQDCSGLTVYGYDGSTAQTHCKTNGIPFVCPLTEAMFTVNIDEVAYTGQPITKTITSNLTLGTDYTVSYENNTEVGTATFTITGVITEGKGGYTGTVTKNFTITPAPLSGSVTVSIEEKAEEGEENAHVIQVGDRLKAAVSASPAPAGEGGAIQWFHNGQEPVGSGERYTVQEGDTSLRVVYTPNKNYAGTLSATVEVGKKRLVDDVTVERDGDTIILHTHYGPDDVRVVWYRDGEPIEGAEELSYTVTGADKGKTLTFQLLPRDTDSYTGSISSGEGIHIPAEAPGKPGGSVSAGDGKLTVTWTAPADNGSPITGYRILPEEGEPVELGADAGSYTLEGLTNGKTYTLHIVAVNVAGESEKLTLQGTPSGPSPSSPSNPSSPSGSSGGNSGSSSGGNKNTDLKKEENSGGGRKEIPVTVGEKTVTAGIAVLHGEDGGAVITVAEKSIDLLMELIRESGPAEIVMDFHTLDEGDKYTLEFPAKTLLAAAGQEPDTVTLRLPNGEMALSGGGVKALADQGKDKAGVALEVQSGGVIDAAVLVDGEAVDTLPGGVGLKARVPVSGNPKGVVAVLVDRDGNEELLRDSRYQNGQIAVGLPGSAKVMVRNEAKDFDDVPAEHWGEDAIAFVSARKVMTGVTEDGFRPELNTSRGMLVTILYRIEREPEAEGDCFSDVDAERYDYDAIVWAASQDIVNGFGDTTFRPDATTTREQLAAILYRYAKSCGQDVSASAELSGFADGEEIGDWAVDAMKWAVSMGLMKGVGDDLLAPKRNATRAEIATIVMRYWENGAK